MRLRKARAKDIPPLLALINGYALRGLLLRRSEESLLAHLSDFTVAVEDGQVVGCGALTALGPGLAEVRSLAVREGLEGRGIGRRIVEHLLVEAGERGFVEVLALTRRVSFFEALGFTVTRRERFLDKLAVDCQTCPMNLCCDETAVVRPPQFNGLTAESPERDAGSVQRENSSSAAPSANLGDPCGQEKERS